ncbi:histone deacetylase HDT2-like [Miscanthus floridulus]|uniref:histone deacetylase HDT2-like n=1 Tax=Miscanthus floridulus TaxID=154761 RepID=UPI00345895F7
MDPGKLQTDIGSDDDISDEDYVDSEEGETSDDEDFSDEDASESSNEDDEDSPKDKNRPAEKTLKTPPEKKARMTTPSKGKNTNEKCSGTGMRSGYVHVATPYPSKLVKKTSSIVERPKQPTGYACNSCSRTFNSYIALKTHCKVKKHKRSPHT